MNRQDAYPGVSHRCPRQVDQVARRLKRQTKDLEDVGEVWASSFNDLSTELMVRFLVVGTGASLNSTHF